MGVHYSRIQSLDLDVLGTSELLVSTLYCPQMSNRNLSVEAVSVSGFCFSFSGQFRFIVSGVYVHIKPVKFSQFILHLVS